MIFRILIAAALILFSSPAPAQDSEDDGRIGVFAEVEGVATRDHDGHVSIAAVDQPVYLNDVIETGEDSKVLILFADDSEFSLGDNARLAIDDYVFDPDGAEKNTGRFSVLRGTFLMTSGLMTKAAKHDVRIETAYGAIGLRGTTVCGGMIDDEYNVFVQDGEVLFATGRGNVRIGPGQGSKVRHGNAIPERAKTWGEDKVKRIMKPVALKRHDEVQKRVGRLKERHKALREKRKTHEQAPGRNEKPGKADRPEKTERTQPRPRHADPASPPDRRKSDVPVHRTPAPGISPPPHIR